MVLTKSWKLIVLVMSAFIIYLPGLPGGFLFDDFWNILDNPLITSKGFSLEGAWGAFKSGESGPLGRPLAMLSFYLNYQISGVSPLGFKLVNITIHALNSVLVFLIVQRFYMGLSGPYKSGISDKFQWLAFFVALLWAVHPINLTTTLYAVQRMNGLSALFILMGILFYLKLRQSESLSNTRFIFGLLGVALCGLLAVLSKENGVLLFLYLFVIECMIFNWRTSSIVRKRLLVSCYVLVLLLPIMVVLLFFSDRLFDGYEVRPYSPVERLLTQARVIWFYIYQIFLPQAGSFGLHHDDFRISHGLFTPISTFLSIAGLVILFFGTVCLRKISPLFSFGIIWFFCGHAMESTVLALDMVYEHRNYLPAIGLVMIIAGVIEKLFDKGYVLSSKFVCIALVMLFALITAQRAYDWRDPIILAERTAQQHPNSVKSQYAVGYNYMKLFQLTGEQQYVDKSVEALKKTMAVSKSESLPFLAMVYTSVLNNIEVDDSLLQEVYLRLKTYPVGQPELNTITEMAKCHLKEKCPLSEDVLLNIFGSLFANKYLTDKRKDSMLESYGVYLYSIPKKQIEAVNVLRGVASRNPDILQYRINLVEVLMDSAEVLMASGQVSEANLLMRELKEKFGIGGSKNLKQ